MFGFFKKKENRVERVDQRYKEVATVIVKTFKQNPNIVALPNIAENIARDSLRNLTEQQLLESSILAMALWSMACTANTAFKDNDFDTANAIAQLCIPLAGFLMKTNPNDYSEIEFSIINTSIEFIKEIQMAVQ